MNIPNKNYIRRFTDGAAFCIIIKLYHFLEGIISLVLNKKNIKVGLDADKDGPDSSRDRKSRYMVSHRVRVLCTSCVLLHIFAVVTVSSMQDSRAGEISCGFSCV